MSWDSFWKEGPIDFLNMQESKNEKKKRKAEELFDDLSADAADVSVGEPIYDENGRIIGYSKDGEQVKDYSSLWGQLDEAKEMGIPDLDSWMTDQGYEMFDPMGRDETGSFTNQTMSDMQGLIDDLTLGPSAMELGEAQAYAAQLMGIDPAEYETVIGGLLDKSMAPVDSLQGMSDEERAAREKVNRNDLRNMEQTASRLIDNIQASTGSVARSYAAADQALGQINDAQLQQSMTMAQDDYARKLQESEAAERQWGQMVQAGSMSQANYLQLLTQSKSQALQGYATQVNTMLQQNQQYLNMYGADAQAIQANIDNIYKAINAEIGIDDKAMSDIERQYQMEMAPILTQMDIALQQIELAESEISTFDLGAFIMGTGLVLSAALPIVGPLAAAALITGGTGIIGSSF